MTIQHRPALALLAVVVLNLGTLHSWGFYSPWAFAAVIISFGIAVAALLWTREGAAAARAVELGLVGPAAVALGVAAVFTARLWYAEDTTGHRLLRVFALLHLTLTAVLVLVGPRMEPLVWKRSPLVLGMILVLGWAMRSQVLHESPDPVVDVFSLLRDGADRIIAGTNPYTGDIVSPYQTRRARRFAVAEPHDPRPAGYPPLPLLLAVPPRLVGADVRWSNVLGELVAASALAALGLRRRRPVIGLVMAAVYLNLPHAPFMIEQSWYEPMIAALLGLGFVLAEARGPSRAPGYVLLGLGLTAKQFGLPLLAPLAAGHRRNLRLVALGLAAGGLVILPWLLWSPRDFLDTVVWKHLARPLQPQSITLGSFLLNEFGLTIPRAIDWTVAAAAIAGISLATPRDSAATALGLGTVLLAFCLFHTQGFPNYFYLVQYLWLFGFVALLPRPEEPHDVALRPAA